MSRNPEYQFVPTNAEDIEAKLVSVYERMTGITVRPASPEMQYIKWVGSIIIQERVLNNYTGNQNIPSRAEGENLDALAELFMEEARPKAKSAVCTMRFEISEPQDFAVLIPAGTRVTDTNKELVWETSEDHYINSGESHIDVQVHCQTTGIVGNGYVKGQINTAVDIYDYYSKCANITTSDGGADEATDEEFYELLRASMDGYSCAGARGSYEYFAKRVSTEIGDVIANSPTPGVVKLYVLKDDGTLATDEIKSAVLAACNADTVRPLTDQVFVEDAEPVEYNISFTYYVQTHSSISAVQAIDDAIQKYVSWQGTKLGRDINPSTLIGLLMQTGIKRVELTEPAFTVLRDDNRSVPQVAQVKDITVINGGYEDE